MRHEDDERWPYGLEALRPDDVARARIRRTVRAEAAARLRARRRRAWEEVAAGWSTILVPLAALLAVAFAGLAYRAATPPAGEAASAPVTVEELVGSDAPGEPFGYLTGTDEPSADRVLTAVILYEEPR